MEHYVSHPVSEKALAVLELNASGSQALSQRELKVDAPADALRKLERLPEVEDRRENTQELSQRAGP